MTQVEDTELVKLTINKLLERLPKAFEEGDFLSCKGILRFMGCMYINKSITKDAFSVVLEAFKASQTLASALIQLTSLPIIYVISKEESIKQALDSLQPIIQAANLPILPINSPLKSEEF
jgi:hypothetical protein